METLQGIDAMFLALETGTSHLQVGVVLVLDPPEGRRSLFSTDTRYAQIRRVFEQRVHLVRPLRQRAVPMPLGLYQPVWLDDPAFDLDDHVHRSSLPEPGGRTSWRTSSPTSWPGRSTRVGRCGRWSWSRGWPATGRRSSSSCTMRSSTASRGRRCSARSWTSGPRSGDPVPGGAVGAGADPVVGRAPPARGRRPGPPAGGGPGHAPPGHGRHRRRDGPQPGAGRAGSAPPPAPFSAPRTSLNGNLSPRRAVSDGRGAARRRQARPPGLRVHGERRPPDGDLGGGPRPAGGAGGASGRPARRVRPRVDPSRRGRPARNPSAPDTRRTSRSATGCRRCSCPGDGRGRAGRTAAAIAAAAGAAKAQEALLGGELLEDLARMAVPAVSARVVRWAAGLRLFDRLPPMFNLVASTVPGPDLDLWSAAAGSPRCTGRPDHRGRRPQHDGDELPRHGLLRPARLPAAGPGRAAAGRPGRRRARGALRGGARRAGGRGFTRPASRG